MICLVSELIKHLLTKLLMKISQNGIIFWPFEKLEKAKSKTLDDVVLALDRRFEMSKNKRLNSSGPGRSNRKKLFQIGYVKMLSQLKRNRKAKLAIY